MTRNVNERTEFKKKELGVGVSFPFMKIVGGRKARNRKIV